MNADCHSAWRLTTILPLVAAIGLCSCTGDPTASPLVGIALLQADKNPDGNGPAIQVRLDEQKGDKVERYALTPGKEWTVGPGFASVSGQVRCEGSIKVSQEREISGRIVVTTSRDVFIGVSSKVPNGRVLRDGQEVNGMTNPLPAGEYVVEFSGEVNSAAK